MKALIPALWCCLSAANSFADTEGGCCRTADLLLHNAVVYTAYESNSTHQALVINDGRFVFVGANEAATGGWCDAARVIDL